MICIGAWFTWQGTSSNWSDYQNNTEQIKAEAQKDIGERCIGITGPIKQHCVNDIENAAKDKEKAEADLYAQRQMAEWAFAVGITGFISVFLSLFGIGFVWRSLELNRDAVQAATEGNSNSLRAMKADLRPWMQIDEISISNLRVTETAIKFAASVKARNIGRSPADSVELRVSLHREDVLRDPHRFIEERSAEVKKLIPKRANSVFPEQCIPLELIQVTGIDRSLAHTQYIVFISVCYLWQGFDEVHQTSVAKFVHLKDPNRPANEILGLDMTPGAVQPHPVVLTSYGAGTYAD